MAVQIPTGSFYFHGTYSMAMEQVFAHIYKLGLRVVVCFMRQCESMSTDKSMPIILYNPAT